jgi:hypothetical protein
MSELPKWNFNDKTECTDDKDVWVYGFDDLVDDIDVGVVNMADAWIVDDLHYELVFECSNLSLQ